MCFTTLKSKSKSLETHALQQWTYGDIEAHFFSTIQGCAPLLSHSMDDVFLCAEYWQALENAPPQGMKLCYIVLTKQGKTVGFIPFQILHFNARKSVNFDDSDHSFAQKIKKKIAQKVDFNTLVLGNLSLTGQHLYWFDNQFITEELKYNIIFSCILNCKKSLTEYNIIIKNVLLKEFFTTQNALDTEGYIRFSVEPNFVMPIDEKWHNFDDYLAAITSKYRVRAKRAFKKLGPVEKKEFNEERILAHQATINHLYKAVSEKSGFNMVNLHPDYFYQMKCMLGERFRLFGYFLDNQLIGFYSTVDNGEELDAHFIEHQTYLNFLLDFIKLAIEMGAKSINFSRTAHEIKSSVGALPHEMFLYIKHDNKIVNRLLPFVPEYLSPRIEWTPRNPFPKNTDNID
jgi:hypothetical protein